MSNRFNAWVPTKAANLPIDYYQSALSLREQRTGDALQKINEILAAYGQIQPLSNDPKALYDETIDKIKNDISELAKLRLDTPEAQRRVNQIINDPTSVGNLDKVLLDAAYGAQAQQKVNDYLAKNPEVNAVPYLVLLNSLGNEKGDSKAFNPNRFKNLGAIPDYVDIHQKVADEVTRLKANETELQKMMGPKYVTYKEAGVLEDRIRDLATSRVLSDPAMRAQFDRNVLYSYYQKNPYDLKAGREAVADGYLTRAKDRVIAGEAAFAELTKGKTEKEILEDRNLALAKLQLDGMRKDRDDLQETYDEHGADAVNQKAAFNAFVESFYPYAYKETSETWKWDELYLQNLREAAADRRVRMRIDAANRQLQEAFSGTGLSIPNVRQQVDPTPDQYASYMKTILPSVILDKHGQFSESNYKGQLVNIKGKYYLPSDVKVLAGDKVVRGDGEGTTVSEELDSRLWESAGSTKVPGGRIRAYVKVGAQPVSKTDTKSLYSKGLTDLRTYLTNAIPGGNLTKYDNLNTDKGIKAAIQDIVKLAGGFESTYSMNYSALGSNTNEMRSLIADLIGKTGVKDIRGNDISPSNKSGANNIKTLQDALRKGGSNIAVNFQHFDRFWDTPVYSFTIDGVQYTAPMFNEHQAILGRGTSVLKGLVSGKVGVQTSGNDLIVSGMNPHLNEKGEWETPLVNAVFYGGNTSEYQDKAKAAFDAQVSKLENIGFSKDEATSYLNSNSDVIAKFLADPKNGTRGFKIEKDGKTAEITQAVGMQVVKDPNYKGRGSGDKTMYFSYSNLGYPVSSLGDMLHEDMNYFGSTSNPTMALPQLDYRRSKLLTGTFLYNNLIKDGE